MSTKKKARRAGAKKKGHSKPTSATRTRGEKLAKSPAPAPAPAPAPEPAPEPVAEPVAKAENDRIAGAISHSPETLTLDENPLADDEPGEHEIAGAEAAFLRPDHSLDEPEEPAPAPERPTASVEDVKAQIRELEARLDKMIRKAARKSPPSPDARERAESAARAVTDRLYEQLPLERPGGDDGSVIDVARELLSSDYYLRQWGRLGMRNRSEEVDEFGLDPKYEARFQPILDFLYKRYFRVETVGAEHVPSEGRCVVVANHSGTIPYDGLMLKTALRSAHPAQRDLRWLAEDFIFYLPFAGAFMNRLGAVRACQENAERLLRGERLVAVFPEGVKGIGKLFRDRYRLQRFGRGGFIRLCLRTKTPIVPCAILGAEEATPMLFRFEGLSDLLGVPYVPITPTFPALGPLGLVPAPTKWKIVFGEPVDLSGYGPEAADDTLLVGRLSERVRATIQAMVDRGLADRRSVWFG